MPNVVEVTDISELIYDGEGKVADKLDYGRLLVPLEFEVNDGISETHRTCFYPKDIRKILSARGEGWFIPSTALIYNVLRQLLERRDEHGIEQLLRQYTSEFFIQTSDAVVPSEDEVIIFRYAERDEEMMPRRDEKGRVISQFQVPLSRAEAENLSGLGKWCYEVTENEDKPYGTPEEIQQTIDIVTRLTYTGHIRGYAPADVYKRSAEKLKRTPKQEREYKMAAWEKVLGMSPEDVIRFVKSMDAYLDEIYKAEIEKEPKIPGVISLDGPVRSEVSCDVRERYLRPHSTPHSIILGHWQYNFNFLFDTKGPSDWGCYHLVKKE